MKKFPKKHGKIGIDTIDIAGIKAKENPIDVGHFSILSILAPITCSTKDSNTKTEDIDIEQDMIFKTDPAKALISCIRNPIAIIAL